MEDNEYWSNVSSDEEDFLEEEEEEDVLSYDDEDEDEFRMADLKSSFAQMSTKKKNIANLAGPAPASAKASGITTANGSGTSTNGIRYYDKIYFDSDEELDDEEVEGEAGADAKRKEKRTPNPKGKQTDHRVLDNDELLYDEEVDLKDEAWVRKKFTGKEVSDPETAKGGKTRKWETDAVLNCPSCFVHLCFDCQRHDRYENQYRAMFVTENCEIVRNQILRVQNTPQSATSKPKGRKGDQKKKGAQDTNENETTEIDDQNEMEDNSNSAFEIYHPVRCRVCQTEVAVYDKDEVYHFFNTIAS